MIPTQPQPPPGVGDSVTSRCTRCKKATRHIVISLVEGRPARVQCTFCEGFHRYRPLVTSEPSRSSRVAPARRITRKDKVDAELEREWSALMEKAAGRQTVVYAGDRGYEVDDRVDHPTFGPGVVRKLPRTGMVEIHFRAGPKRLICA